MQEYNFRTIPQAGMQNGRADALSTKEELNLEEKVSNEVQLLWRLIMHERLISSNDIVS